MSSLGLLSAVRLGKRNTWLLLTATKPRDLVAQGKLPENWCDESKKVKSSTNICKQASSLPIAVYRLPRVLFKMGRDALAIAKLLISCDKALSLSLNCFYFVAYVLCRAAMPELRLRNQKCPRGCYVPYAMLLLISIISHESPKIAAEHK